MNRRREVTAALLVLAMLAAGSPAWAQQAEDPTVDFVVTPSRIELSLAPGAAADVTIEVFNRGATPLVLRTYVADIEIPQEELVGTDDLAFTASRWSTFTAEQLEVPPEGSAAAVLSVVIPEGTPAGGYHAYAFFQSAPLQTDSGLVPAGRIGATLLLDVAEPAQPVTRSAQATETALEIQWNGIFDPVVSARTVIENTGDSHVLAGGIHTYRAWPGSENDIVEVGPATVLRGTRHTFTSSFDQVPLIGKVTVTSEIVYQVGPDELPVIITQATAWIIPWHVITVLIVALAGLGLLWWVRRKTKRSSGPSTSTEETEPCEEEVSASLP